MHKQLWVLTKDKSYLDEAVRAYERGFYLRNDYYNGINFAFLLNVRSVNNADPGRTIADFIQARRVRKEVLEICREWLSADTASVEGVVSIDQKHPSNAYWVLATVAEAYFGVGDNVQGQEWLEKAKAASPEQWMVDATVKQLANLETLLADSPLSRIMKP